MFFTCAQAVITSKIRLFRGRGNVSQIFAILDKRAGAAADAYTMAKLPRTPTVTALQYAVGDRLTDEAWRLPSRLSVEPRHRMTVDIHDGIWCGIGHHELSGIRDRACVQTLTPIMTPAVCTMLWKGIKLRLVNRIVPPVLLLQAVKSDFLTWS